MLAERSFRNPVLQDGFSGTDTGDHCCSHSLAFEGTNQPGSIAHDYVTISKVTPGLRTRDPAFIELYIQGLESSIIRTTWRIG